LTSLLIWRIRRRMSSVVCVTPAEPRSARRSMWNADADGDDGTAQVRARTNVRSWPRLDLLSSTPASSISKTFAPAARGTPAVRSVIFESATP
jgi:hypothetical protein